MILLHSTTCYHLDDLEHMSNWLASVHDLPAIVLLKQKRSPDEF